MNLKFFVLVLFFFCTISAFTQTPEPVSVSKSIICVGDSLAILTDLIKVRRIHWIKGNTVLKTSEHQFGNGRVIGGTGQAGGNSNQFDSPLGLFVDKAGAVYVADGHNHRVQKWARGSTNGITVAGGNGAGDAPNQLKDPSGVFVDDTGDIFVADKNNHRIQKWSPGSTQGVTVAGGNGSGDNPNQLSFPYSIFIDSDRNIYISDQDNQRIQKWPLNSISGTTVAGGNGFGVLMNQFRYPANLYVDDQKNIFVVDSNGSRIQKWTESLVVTTVAGGNGPGNHQNQLYIPWGMYFDKEFNTIYIADNGNHRIQMWSPGDDEAKTVVEGASEITYPMGVFLDADKKDLYAIDFGGNRIKKWENHIDHFFKPDEPGLYWVQVIFDNNSIWESDEILVNSLPEKPLVTTTDATLVFNNTSADTPLLQWIDCDNDNMEIVNETSSTFLPEFNGQYAVSITDEHGCKATSECVTIIVTGVEEEKLKHNLNVYPNPVHDVLTIEVPRHLNESLKFVLLNSMGNVVYHGDHQGNLELNFIGQPSGIYFIKVLLNDKTFNMKIIKP